jgi:ferredoxin--NADP+ reductase
MVSTSRKISMAAKLTETEVAELRQEHYNACVTQVRRVHDELIIFRVRPDGGVPPFEAGQFTLLGMGYWEPRVPHTQAEQLSDDEVRAMARRAYSISFPIVDAGVDPSGAVLHRADCNFLEFYVALVRESPGAPPALTPRLFGLKPNDRLFVGTKISGNYTLAPVADGQDVIFLATGTGEAPHNAMIAELLTRGHSGRIICAVCVRQRADLAYENAHRAIERRFPNYHYLPLTTREPINLDRSHTNYVGKQYIQDLIETGRLEAALGRGFRPGQTHFYLCGSPAMIGVPHVDENGKHIYPKPTGVVELLEQRGFRADLHGHSGNIHFEKYW